MHDYRCRYESGVNRAYQAGFGAAGTVLKRILLKRSAAACNRFNPHAFTGPWQPGLPPEAVLKAVGCGIGPAG